MVSSVKEEGKIGIETRIQWCDSILSSNGHEDQFWLFNRESGNRSSEAAGRDKIGQFARQVDEALGWPEPNWDTRKKKRWLAESRRLILVNGIGDPFSPVLPRDWLAPYVDRMADCPHIWLFLTKGLPVCVSFSRKTRRPTISG
jgi:hypothetical protein